MPKRKNERGRPMKNLYPPRIDATPEDMAQAMFSLPAGRKWPHRGGTGLHHQLRHQVPHGAGAMSTYENRSRRKCLRPRAVTLSS